MNAADYLPPRWLRNPHVQSVLGSSGLRRIRSRQL
ncbi:alpha/beta hydrolase, partial [Xanthomonas oryzae pv. oryzae]